MLFISCGEGIYETGLHFINTQNIICKQARHSKDSYNEKGKAVL